MLTLVLIIALGPPDPRACLRLTEGSLIRINGRVERIVANDRPAWHLHTQVTPTKARPWRFEMYRYVDLSCWRGEKP
jgi:hypothetical protein